jgi:hypothetical protein
VGDPIEVDLDNQTGYTVDKVVDSGDPDMWKQSPFDRGNSGHELLDSNLPHNYPTIDKFDAPTGTGTSIKTLDTSAASYQTQAGLQNKLTSYIDKLDEFPGTKWGGVDTQGNIIKKALEIAIPNIPLNDAQKAAIDAAKEYAKSKGIDLIITVIK